MLLVLCFIGNTSQSRAADVSYLHELQQRAETAGLHWQRYWHLLLHYRPTLVGGYESEADEAGYFLAPNGKTDPKTELEATLAQFFSTEPVGRSRQPARGAFIARYHWLKAELAIDDARLPAELCERFNSWLKELNPASMTLIFPSAYLNNPSSMFGHLLLRVDQRGQTEQTRLLAYTINYSADVTTDNGFVFAVLGVAGGFKGYFSSHPYYIKAREYGDFENRDLWEYRLNLTPEQIERLLMHTWEMGNASFDYFFFKETCAYQILSLIEVADPDIHLTDRFWFYTFPSDGVRLIAEETEAGQGRHLSPRSRYADSPRTRSSFGVMSRRGLIELFTIRTRLAPIHSRVCRRSARLWCSTWLPTICCIRSQRRITTPLFTGSATRRSWSLEASSRLLPFRSPSSRLRVRPSRGTTLCARHWARAGARASVSTSSIFASHITICSIPSTVISRCADRSFGHRAAPLLPQRSSRIERFTLVDIVSLSPVNELFQSPSWKINTGFETVQHNGCRFCRIGNLNGSQRNRRRKRLAETRGLFRFHGSGGRIRPRVRQRLSNRRRNHRRYLRGRHRALEDRLVRDLFAISHWREVR